MRYRPEHKEAVRRRILARAGRLFRRHGYDGVGIDRIMAAADLTRGGFYGYFRSKADLFAQVLAEPHDFVERLRARSGSQPAELRSGAAEVIGGYLDAANRQAVGTGCPVAALSVDVARAPRSVRRAYTDKVEDLLAELSRGLAPRPDAEPVDPRAARALALCVGGIVVARALDDARLADALTRACRDGAVAELEGA
jgi:TetR/AcrR family transcriptional repressor of nem operon